MSFITVHMLQALPMHNLNRDQNGLPKAQIDGGVQRARLSSQALKRPARIAFREAISGLNGAYASVRTKDADLIVTDLAKTHAAQIGAEFDPKRTSAAARKIIGALAAGEGKEADNILLFSDAELETLARALVEDPEAKDPAFIQDFSSPSLDVAAFGRMFAQRSDLSTQAAVAVSHAVTTHAAKFTIDYFTAVDEYDGPDADGKQRTDAGAAHLGLAYYTSGVYYRTFTIDTDQLKRSWSGISGDTARAQIEALVIATIKALPTGRLTNTNAHTLPYLVYVEDQASRVAYDFETPVEPGHSAVGDTAGGYKEPSAKALAAQVALARIFDPANVSASAVIGETFDHEFPGEQLASVNDAAAFVARRILDATQSATAAEAVA